MNPCFALRALAASLLCALPIDTAHPGVNEWTINGPPSGTYRDLEASTTDGNVFYAAYGRSFHRSSDGGLTWEAYDFTGEVVDVAVDPADGQRILVAVLDEGLFRSLNGGLTFTQIAPATPSIWAATIATNDVIYYATVTGFRRSTDGGDSFGAPVPVLQTITQIVVSAADANLVFAVRGTLLMRSSNGGATWTESAIGVGFDSINSLVRLPSGAMAAALNSGLYTSSNDGASWTLRLAGSFASVAVDPSSPDTLIAASVSNAALLRSTNAGLTWSPIGVARRGVPRRAVVGRASSNRLLTANDRGVQRSDNGGVSWQYSTTGPVASGLLSMATTVVADSRVYAYTTGTGLFAAAQDSPWERLDALDDLPPAQATLAVKPGAPQSVFLASFGRGVYRSSDGGRGWSFPNGDLNGYAVDSLGFDPVDPEIMYASVAAGGATPFNGLYRSIDGGVSWAPHSVDLSPIHAYRMAVDAADRSRIFLAGYQGFFAGDIGGLYRSTNGGVNWSRIAFAGQDVNDVAIDPGESQRIYAATSTGLHVSNDGGASFARNDAFAIITSQPARRVVIDPVVPTTLYAASLDPGGCCAPQTSSVVLRSVDRGQTWETLRAASDAPRWYVGQLLLDPNVPSLVHIDTGVRGVASYEIYNDLSVAIRGHSGPQPMGASSTFDVRAEHLGALAATRVRIITTLPAGLSNVSAVADRGSCSAAGVTLTCSVPVLRPGEVVNVEVKYTPTSSTALNVQAGVVAHEPDGVTDNDMAAASAFTGEVADLSVAATASAANVTPGDSVTYAVVVSNSGPVGSSSSSLTFTVGSGLALGATPSGCTASGAAMTCTLDALAIGASRPLQFTATTQAAGSLTATARIAPSADAADPDPDNNTAEASIVSREPVPPPPAGGGDGGGGGGGSMAWGMLLGLALFARARRLAQSTDGESTAAGGRCWNHSCASRVRSHVEPTPILVARRLPAARMRHVGDDRSIGRSRGAASLQDVSRP